MEMVRSKPHRGIFNGLKFNIISIHMTPETIGELVELAEDKGAVMVAHPDLADIVITEISTRARLERHITWEVALGRVVVDSRWLKKSAAANKLLPFDQFIAVPGLVAIPPTPRTPKQEHKPAIPASGSRFSPIELSDTDDSEEFDAASIPRYCVQRRTPLICRNQELVRQFAVIKQARWLDENEVSALSYARTIASIKAYPKVIRTVAEVEKLPYVGPKARLKISEFLSSGMIEETRNLEKDEYYKTLGTFTSLYGIGNVTAKRLYSMGMRTLEHLEDYYRDELKTTKNKANIEGMLHSLALQDDFRLKISRAEVEEMARLITEEMSIILPGFIYTITGGYRRGKPESNDVDIVFSHPTSGKGAGALQLLITRLHNRGLITHVLPATSFRTPGSIKSYSEDQAVQRTLSVFALPQDSPSFPHNPAGQPRKHRRIDLLFAPIEVYWCTVIGWSGSIMFERDLRSWCKEKHQYKFDSSGLTRRRDAARIAVKSERHLFELVGLPYIEPIWRNCDY